MVYFVSPCYCQLSNSGIHEQSKRPHRCTASRNRWAQFSKCTWGRKVRRQRAPALVSKPFLHVLITTSFMPHIVPNSQSAIKFICIQSHPCVVTNIVYHFLRVSMSGFLTKAHSLFPFGIRLRHIAGKDVAYASWAIEPNATSGLIGGETRSIDNLRYQPKLVMNTTSQSTFTPKTEGMLAND